MANLLGSIRYLNSLGSTELAEPYAGGAGASLALLFMEETRVIHLNDADPAIADFWWTLTNRPRKFINQIDSVALDIEEWQRQRDVYRQKASTSRLQRGFAAFYLNRCNRSGIIINGGPIGGYSQDGKWRLDARFNRRTLRERCERVAEYKSRIKSYQLDGIEFIRQLDSKHVSFFIDPPYFEKGSLLYLNLLDPEYHFNLANTLRGLQYSTWVLTYDDCKEIRQLYEGWANIRPFSLSYAAAQKRRGKELLITPRTLRLPTFQLSDAIDW